MKAMVIEEFGGPEVFKPMEMERPELLPGHIMIEVHATSVNAVDLLIRHMGPPFLAPPFPAVLQSDVAGVVLEVADDVTAFKPGDEVYGCAGGFPGMGGALAELMVADANLVAHKPKSLSMAEAAALPLVTITAWEALHERTRIGAGDKVLIHGGAGGVGHIAVQLARAAGAEVYATVSTDEKAEIAHQMGATTTINYREQEVESYVEQYTAGEGFDVVFDTVGNENLMRSFEAAKLNGEVVTTVSLGQYDMSVAHLRGLTLHIVFMLIPLLHNRGREHHGQILKETAAMVDRGELRPLLDTRHFSFEQVADAHRLMESGEHLGKIVITRN